MKACHTGADDKSSCDNVGAFLQIAAITASLNANIKLICQAISAIYYFIQVI